MGRCLVVFNLETESVDFFWWCTSNQEYIEMREKLIALYPAKDYEISTEYSGSSYAAGYSHAAGYQN